MIRLKVIRRGRGLRARVMGLLLPLVSGGSAPGFVKVLVFRPRFFGAPIGRYGDAVLRGPGLWAIGERELFGAAVSATNACGYCTGVHAQIATECLGEATVDALVHGTGEVPSDVGSPVVPMVAFLRRLSHDPDRLTAADVKTLREGGIGDDAIWEAAHAAALLEICNRVNTALGVDAMSPEGNRRAAAMLLRRGYDL
ncbi:MAG: hypothetical protein QOE37_1117 [Microbacteriaceae bacterium]|nr:hypothetical protein [Microbacteriaceae bacterium]